MQVVQAIGAAETKLLDFGAPSRIDGEAAIKLVNVSKDLGIKQYIMVTSLGTTKLGFPASMTLPCPALPCPSVPSASSCAPWHDPNMDHSQV